ncbi:invasion associated locus B family protein [Antarcticimicrobium luteum]|nr:invasion associated locus B family protein [Antarcticimicrobium luteum]
MIAGAACAAAPDARRFADWTLLEVPGQGCVLQYRAVAPGSGLVLADLYLSPVAEGGAILSVRVPVGASIADRAVYRHLGAGRAVPLIWQTCNRQTCLAQVHVTEEEIGRLRAGRAIELAFVPVPGARRLSFPVSLMGVTAGLRAALACTSW